jgi:hypothetical protein
MREELGLKYKKEERVTYLKRGFTRAERKNTKQNPKMQATQTKKTPGILPTSTVLAHPEKCGFSAQNASCGHMNNALMAPPLLEPFPFCFLHVRISIYIYIRFS